LASSSAPLLRLRPLRQTHRSLPVLNWSLGRTATQLYWVTSAPADPLVRLPSFQLLYPGLRETIERLTRTLQSLRHAHVIIRPPSHEKRPTRSAARETRVFSGRLARPVHCWPVRLPCAVTRASVIPLFFNRRSERARLISIWAVGQRALESNPSLSSRTSGQVREIESLILVSELKVVQHQLLKVHRLRLQAPAVVNHLQDLRQEPLVLLRLLAVPSRVRPKLLKPRVPLDARLISPWLASSA
jgi:hypothetical protein